MAHTPWGWKERCARAGIIAALSLAAAAPGAEPADQPATKEAEAVRSVQTAAGTAYRIAAAGSEETGLHWGQAVSPDGKHVAYLTLRNVHPDKYLRMRNALTICATDGRSRWVAMPAIRNRCAKMHLQPRLVWTADGRTLYCINNADPWGQGPVRIHKIDVAARKVHDMGLFLKDLTYFLMRAAVGPDGRSIVCASSDHRLHQTDPGHNFYPIVIVTPDGNELRTEQKYKDVLSSPLGKLTVGVQLVAHELHTISPDGKAKLLHTFDKGHFVVRLHLAGETDYVLLVTGPQRDRRAWKPTMGFRNEPVFKAVLIDPNGQAALVSDDALQDAIVPLPQADTVLVCEADEPYLYHPFAKKTDKLEITGPHWAVPSPSAASPYAVLKPLAKSRGRVQVRPDETVLLNWKTGKAITLDAEPFDGLRLPVSWSADGKWLAFSRAAGAGQPVEVPKMIDPPHEFIAGEIWTLKLNKEGNR
ncbi:MAG TPA: hypothetical protein VNA25_30875 [Phycisphaerae bacterium]|nr:hypothetical protein [Phycisphaerae bacterium]HUT62264.1 hypothetical protein [Phycisphaerae bacterium]